MLELGALNTATEDPPWVHTFLYGDSGAGKTFAAGTWPKPVFVVPKNEGSIVTLRGQGIPYFEVVDMSKTQLRNGVGSMNAVIDHLEKIYRQDMNNCPFDTIVLESLTHYSDLAVEQISNGGTKQMSPFEWGLLSNHLRNVHLRLRNMQVHVVFTALAKSDENEDKTISGFPLIQGQTAVKLPSACDIIGYCEVTGGKNAESHKIHFRRYRHFIARTRFPQIPSVIEDFHFSKIEPYLR